MQWFRWSPRCFLQDCWGFDPYVIFVFGIWVFFLPFSWMFVFTKSPYDTRLVVRGMKIFYWLTYIYKRDIDRLIHLNVYNHYILKKQSTLPHLSCLFAWYSKPTTRIFMRLQPTDSDSDYGTVLYIICIFFSILVIMYIFWKRRTKLNCSYSQSNRRYYIFRKEPVQSRYGLPVIL